MSPLLLKGGYPFALDMSFGPRMKVPPEAFGLGVEFGRRLPDFIWISLLSEVIPPEALVRVLLLSIPFVSGCAAFAAFGSLFGDWGRRAGHDPKAQGTSVVGAVYAGLLYELNPFVYQRLAAGHWHILLGYAFYPLLVVATVRFLHRDTGAAQGSPSSGMPGEGRASGPRRAFWAVVLASAALGLTSFAVSVMGLITLLVAVGLWASPGPPSSGIGRVRAKARLASSVLAAWLPGNATWLVPAVLKARKAGGFTELDWRAFLVRGNDPWEAFLNVVRLTGFYRDDLAPPTLGRPAGWLTTGLVVALALGGAAALFRHRHRLFALSAMVPVVFVVLALGERAPIVGPVLGWAYVRLPGWQIFRETQKLLVPVCFFYALLGGYAVSCIARLGATTPGVPDGPERPGGGACAAGPNGSFGPEGALLAVAALLLPFALSPDLFFGLRGRISVAPYPRGWYEAAAAVPPGDGKLLVFPWHQHMPFEFTGGRTNVNPAADFFPKEVVQSTRAEFPGFLLGVSDPVDAYVRDVIALGPALARAGDGGGGGVAEPARPGRPGGERSEGEPGLSPGGMRAALAPLGVDSVLVLKTADWEAYRFLEDIPDLRKVVDNDDLRLYVVVDPTAAVTGFDSASPATRVQRDDRASSGSAPLMEAPCSGTRVQTEKGGPGDDGSASPPPPGDGSLLVRKSPFWYETPGPGCWLVPEAFDPGWTSQAGLVGEVWGGAAVGVAADRPTAVVYWPAFLAIAAHVLSAAALVGSASALVIGPWSRRRKYPAGAASPVARS